MKKIFCLMTLTVFLFTSCSTTTKTTDTLPALSLPNELIYEMSLINQCDLTFWKSKYGRLVLDKNSNTNIEFNAFFEALKNKPKACTITQAMGSIAVIGNVRKNLKNLVLNKKLSSDYTTNLKAFQNNLLNSELTMSELLLSLILFQELKEKFSTFNEQTKIINEIKSELNTQQSIILARAIKHDILTMQNFIYRMELLDWSSMSRLGGDIKMPSQTELLENSKFNKYFEILKIENLKITLLENQSCLENKTCNLCYLKIQSQTCPEENLSHSEKLSQFDNSVFLEILVPKYKDLIIKIKIQMSKFEKIN